jgi:hypothetical protein
LIKDAGNYLFKVKGEWDRRDGGSDSSSCSSSSSSSSSTIVITLQTLFPAGQAVASKKS